MKYLRKIMSCAIFLTITQLSYSAQNPAELANMKQVALAEIAADRAEDLSTKPALISFTLRKFPQYQEAFDILTKNNNLSQYPYDVPLLTKKRKSPEHQEDVSMPTKKRTLPQGQENISTSKTNQSTFERYLDQHVPEDVKDFDIAQLELQIENTIAMAMKPTVMAALQKYNPDFIHNFDLASIHTMKDLSPTKPFDNIIHDHNPIIQYVRKYSDTNLQSITPGMQSKSAFMQPIINEWIREWIINTPDAHQNNNNTLLHRAALNAFGNENQQMHIIKLLINAGADLNAQDNTGETALILAVMFSQLSQTAIAQLLINAGADLNAQNADGYTALIFAVLVGRTEIVQSLINERANLNAQNKKGNTALMSAVTWDKIDIAQSLINARADITIQNNDGATAADYAESPEMRALFNLPPLQPIEQFA